jgi:two-component system chemotaxis response regulator CheB
MNALFSGLSVCKPTICSRSFMLSSIYPGPYAVRPESGFVAIIEVVQELPADTPPVVIVQHMPVGFTKMYADRLDRICKMSAKEAENGDRLKQGLIILGHGSEQLEVHKDTLGYYVTSKPGEKVSGHCPSVDVLFSSVAKAAGKGAIGVILTGMGRDGATGLGEMKNSGAYTIGQDKESCVVYGMPCVAFEEGAVIKQAPLSEIKNIIIGML